MATYTPPTISNYNDNPPSNDGSENFTDNGVDWDLHINEIGDPIKNYADAVNNETDSAFDTIDASRPISVLDYGAVGDGSTDDSASIQSAIDFLEANGGGTLYFPNKRFKCNINVEASNIQLVGEAFSSQDPTTSLTLVANTAADPILRIGDGTNVVDGFTCSNMSFTGESGASAKGILIQGAHRCSFHNVSVNSFNTYSVQLTSTATRPTSHIYWSGFYFSTSSDATSVALDIVAGGSYTTALFFSNGTIASNSSAKWGLQNNGSPTTYLSNVWGSLADGKGANLLNSGQLICNGVAFDSGASSDVLVNLDHDLVISTSLRGSITVDGLVKFADATTSDISAQHDLLKFRPALSYPFVIGDFALADSAAANNVQNVYDGSCRIYNSSDRLILESGTLEVRLAAGNDTAEILGNPGSAILKMNNQVAGTTVTFRSGAGSPQGVVAATVGSLYTRTDGGTGTVLYVKETGTSTSSGWVAK